jgi:hypothetical protein
MALTIIDHYEVLYSANQFPPRIWLQNSGKFIGQLIFMAAGATLPADGMSGGQVNLYYHQPDFANILNIFQKEKAVYLLYNGSGPGFENGIQTSAGPMGS